MPPSPNNRVRPVGGLDPEKQKGWLKGIATAEGYYDHDGKLNGDAVPVKAHNPGDLKRGDVGYGTINGITVYPNEDAGMNALARQVNRFYAPGPGSPYDPHQTLRQIAERYTGQDNADNWSKTVGQRLGIEPTQRLIPDPTEAALGMDPEKYAATQAHQAVGESLRQARPVGLFGLPVPQK